MGSSNLKKTSPDNCKRILNIKFEQDLSVGLGAILGDSCIINKDQPATAMVDIPTLKSTQKIKIGYIFLTSENIQ